MNTSSIYPAFSFAAFVLWLLAVVMDGPLTAAAGMPMATDFFLPLQILSLLLIGVFFPPDRFTRFSQINCVLTVLLTLALPLVGPGTAPYLMGLLGITGAFVAIQACLSLRQSTAPLISAACGLIAANMLVFPFFLWSSGRVWQFSLVALPLLAIPIIARRQPEARNDPAAVSRWHYLPFILIFQIVSGLMYSFIMPAYQHAAYLPGIELPFYMLAVLTAYRIVQKNLDLTLVCGVVLGMAAFTLLQNQRLPLTINLSMFAMQAAAGFFDLVILAMLLTFPRPIRAFGIGMATICLGILTGKILVSSFANLAEPIVLTGHLVLNLSILTLYFLGRHHYNKPPVVIQPARDVDTAPLFSEPFLVAPIESIQPNIRKAIPVADEVASNASPDESASRMPDHLRLLLSEREYLVLSGTLAGRNFRETARELGISESTVKTYMRRIYEKMGVKGKKELFEMLRRL